MAASNVPPDAPGLSPAEAPYTAWHYLLIQTLEELVTPELLTIKPFFKLGSLPIEADIIMLLKHLDGPALARLVPEFAFMLRYLAWLTVVEYKGPDDSLTLASFATAMAYLWMAWRKHEAKGKLPPLRDLCLLMLYSYKERDLLQTLAEQGFPFIEVETGIMRCDTLQAPIYLMDLVVLSDQDPAALINLLSARHRRYALSTEPGGPRAAAVQRLYYTVLKELKRMLAQEKIKDLPGARELSQDIKEIRRRFVASLKDEMDEVMEDVPVEVRLRGLGPEERLRGLGPEELARLRALLLKDHG